MITNKILTFSMPFKQSQLEFQNYYIKLLLRQQTLWNAIALTYILQKQVKQIKE